jgi:hypothetical protein
MVASYVFSLGLHTLGEGRHCEIRIVKKSMEVYGSEVSEASCH